MSDIIDFTLLERIKVMQADLQVIRNFLSNHSSDLITSEDMSLSMSLFGGFLTDLRRQCMKIVMESGDTK